MGSMTTEHYRELSEKVGWLNLPAALLIALFQIVERLEEIRDLLKERR
jgi:hypothetical protein